MAQPPPDAESLQRVPLSDLQDLIVIGQPLPFRVLDGQGRLLLNEHQVVGGESQWQMLVDRGAWAERSEVLAQRAKRAALAGSPGAGEPARQVRSSLFDGWEQRVWQLDALLRQAMRGAPVGADIAGFADAHLAWVDRDPDVALFLSLRRDDRRFALYALTHGQATATVCLLSARQLGWDLGRQQLMVRAALTMNLSILELQALLAEQSTPPTQRQLAQIRSHPERSRAMLQACGVTDDAWLATVEDHHERAGSGGYPRGLATVTPEAALVRAADVFLAKISPRAQRPALSPQVAARQLFQQEAGGPLAGALIKAVGLYPPGDLVTLRSGEVGVVVRRGAGPAPLVATLSDTQGRPVAQTLQRDTSQPAYAITGPLADRSAYPRVLPERVYGLIEFSQPAASAPPATPL